MPILSAAYVLDVFSRDLFSKFIEFQISTMMGASTESMVTH